MVLTVFRVRIYMMGKERMLQLKIIFFLLQTTAQVLVACFQRVRGGLGPSWASANSGSGGREESLLVEAVVEVATYGLYTINILGNILSAYEHFMRTVKNKTLEDQFRLSSYLDTSERIFLSEESNFI